MKRLILLGVLSLGWVLPALAQKDKRAADILDAMSKKYSALNAYQATFTTTGGAGNYKGDLAVKGDKFRLTLAGQEVFTDGKIMSTYVKETNEVNVQNYDQGDASELNPAKIYSLYKKGYDYKFTGEQKAAGQPVEVVELTPEKKNGQISKVQIAIAKNDKSIKSWKIYDKSGKATSYKIDKFTPNPNLPDNYFVFDKAKHPGVEVIDLR